MVFSTNIWKTIDYLLIIVSYQRTYKILIRIILNLLFLVKILFFSIYLSSEIQLQINISPFFRYNYIFLWWFIGRILQILVNNFSELKQEKLWVLRKIICLILISLYFCKSSNAHSYFIQYLNYYDALFYSWFFHNIIIKSQYTPILMHITI